MLPKFVIRACCIAGGLLLCTALAAERKPSLIGATREEVLARFGEPKGNIAVGNREVLVFNGERVTLRDGRVIDVEETPIETPAPKPATPPPAPSTADATAATSPGTAPAPATDATAAGTAAPSGGVTAQPASTAAATPAPPAEPEVIIKSVRPPSHDVGRTGVAEETPTATPTPSPAPAPAVPAPIASTATPSITVAAKPEAPGPAPAAVATIPTSTGTPSTETPSSAVTESVPVPSTTPDAAAPAVPAATASESTAATTEANSTTSPAVPTTATASTTPVAPKRAKVSPPATEASSAEKVFGRQTYVLAGVVIVVGIGFLIWRRRQRSLLLEVTAVSNPPFAPAATVAAVAAGARFTTEVLNKLEWKRFEELVAAYYNKTGVVASRTKSGPMTPVHIRISWKGEQRPFACVACVPRPAGLVDAKPVQLLSEALASEDVRRGYVVSAGKFGVPARDLAEEKHITLLSGDIFAEKLNALPDPVRAELLKDATTGDYMTPTCPTCETKMARSASDSTQWQCPQCGTTLARG